MRARSLKTARRDRAYAKARAVFLSMHPWCEITWDVGCTFSASEVHHMAGRYPSVFFRTDLWKAACHHCHERATNHPAAAIARGVSVRRHSLEAS